MCKGIDGYGKKEREKGIEQGIEINVEKLLKKNYSAEAVADMLDLELDYVKAVESKILMPA